MDGHVISPELALVDPAAAAAHRASLPAVVLDSAIATALAARLHPSAAAVAPRRVEDSIAFPVWLAAGTYVIVKVAVAVVTAVLLVGFVALAATILPA